MVRDLEAMVGYFALKPPTHPTLINSFANQPFKTQQNPRRRHLRETPSPRHLREGIRLPFARFA